MTSLGAVFVRILTGLLFLCVPLAAQAFPLALPVDAELRTVQEDGQGSFDFPLAAWQNGAFSGQPVDGLVSKSVWRLPAPIGTTLETFAGLRQQLIEQGYDVTYECRTQGCGGFDFRFAVDLIGAPDMLIDLGDFRALTAQNGTDWVFLFVSATPAAHFVQVVTVGETADAQQSAIVTQTSITSAQTGGSLAQQLGQSGRAILADLSFETGASELQDIPFESLTQLAQYLTENPERKVALVGHTDSSGSLEANIALSKRRATAVMDRLIADYGVDPAQIAAEGMGYLAPVASNLTQTGRDTNRRVEVIITSTE